MYLAQSLLRRVSFAGTRSCGTALGFGCDTALDFDGARLMLESGRGLIETETCRGVVDTGLSAVRRPLRLTIVVHSIFS